MKKDYNSPSMEVIELKLQQIIAASGGDKVGGGKVGGGAQLSREYDDIFDDDDWDF